MRKKGQSTSYYGSEKEILDAFAKLLDQNRSANIKVTDITTEAGLAASSFYIHYRSVGDLIEVNEKRILDAVDRTLSSPGFDKLTVQGKWRNILFALYKYHEVLDIMVKTRNIELFEKVFDDIERTVITSQLGNKPLNKDLSHIIKLCLIAELDFWQKEHLSIDYIPVCACHLAFISSCAPRFFARMYY